MRHVARDTITSVLAKHETLTNGLPFDKLAGQLNFLYGKLMHNQPELSQLCGGLLATMSAMSNGDEKCRLLCVHMILMLLECIDEQGRKDFHNAQNTVKFLCHAYGLDGAARNALCDLASMLTGRSL